MTRFLAVFLLSFPLFAAPFQFEPLPPTSQSFIHLRVDTFWRDSCVPSNARVTRDGTTIEILWSVPRFGACLSVVTDWADRVPIGVLDAGVYTVHLKIDDYDGVKTMTTRTLIVSEGAPAIRITPLYASTRGGSPLTLTPVSCGHNPQVTIDGVPVTAVQSGCSAVIPSLPAHAAGPVDVTLQNSVGTFTVKSTLRYLDPAAAPDEEFFERILIPVLYSGPGAFGSQWVTEGVLINASYETLPWFSDVARPCPDCGLSVAPSAIMPLAAFGNRTNGVIVFVPRAIANQVQFGVVSRETSREKASWGTEVPVARERDFERGRRLNLPNVPIDPRLRVMLRIYAIDGRSRYAGIEIRRGATSIASRLVTLSGPCQSTPCNSAEPAHASVDLGTFIPAGMQGPVTVVIHDASSTPARVWGFVSITDNETQHVTVIRPQ